MKNSQLPPVGRGAGERLHDMLTALSRSGKCGMIATVRDHRRFTKRKEFRVFNRARDAQAQRIIAARLS